MGKIGGAMGACKPGKGWGVGPVDEPVGFERRAPAGPGLGIESASSGWAGVIWYAGRRNRTRGAAGRTVEVPGRKPPPTTGAEELAGGAATVRGSVGNDDRSNCCDESVGACEIVPSVSPSI